MYGTGGHNARTAAAKKMGRVADTVREERRPLNKLEMKWSDEILRESRRQAATDRMNMERMKERMARRAAEKRYKAGAREREQKARLEAQANEARLEKIRQDEKAAKRRQAHLSPEPQRESTRGLSPYSHPNLALEGE